MGKWSEMSRKCYAALGIAISGTGLLLSACAVPLVEGRATLLPSGDQAISIEASNFQFAPNVIRARAGVPIQIRVVNDSGFDHNLTVELAGQAALSQDIPAGGQAEVKFTPPGAGRFPIYCNKTGHRAFGMEGVIVAE
ncbi:MAG: cupredoxin domain-containing protein [Candidatus Methylomirabilales bacterium]